MRVAIFALFTFRGSAMKEMRTLLLVCSVVLPIAILAAQAPDPSRLGNYPDAWPTHYGDHSGRRYSPLAQINATNVKRCRSRGSIAPRPRRARTPAASIGPAIPITGAG